MDMDNIRFAAAVEYRRKATELRQIGQSLDADVREKLEKLARRWDELAAAAEVHPPSKQ
jgi:hypothetical protein